MMKWWEKYVGRPWKANPEPPESYNCGELVRAVLLERAGIDTPAIGVNAAVLRDCVGAMLPSRYGLRPLKKEEDPRELDVAFMVRALREDHVGIAVMSGDGLKILHCQQGAGVTWDSPAELSGRGVRRINWYRHEELGGETCLR